MGQTTSEAHNAVSNPLNEIPSLFDELTAVVSDLEDNVTMLSSKLVTVKRNEPSQTSPDSDRSTSTSVGDILVVLIRRVRAVNAAVYENADLLEL